jgi:hypothetical protein
LFGIGDLLQERQSTVQVYGSLDYMSIVGFFPHGHACNAKQLVHGSKPLPDTGFKTGDFTNQKLDGP